MLACVSASFVFQKQNWPLSRKGSECIVGNTGTNSREHIYAYNAQKFVLHTVMKINSALKILTIRVIAPIHSTSEQINIISQSDGFNLFSKWAHRKRFPPILPWAGHPSLGPQRTMPSMHRITRYRLVNQICILISSCR